MKMIAPKHLLIFLWVSSSFCTSASQRSSAELSIIERLDRSVQVLHSFNDRYKKICVECYSGIDQVLGQCHELHPFKSPSICSLVTSMHARHCIEPLFEVWQTFKNRTSVYDPEFLPEFAQITLIIYQELIPTGQDQGILKGHGG